MKKYFTGARVEDWDLEQAALRNEEWAVMMEADVLVYTADGNFETAERVREAAANHRAAAARYRSRIVHPSGGHTEPDSASTMEL